MKLKISDPVKISRTSEFYGESVYDNPAEQIGYIIDVDCAGESYRVEWQHNNSTNSYWEGDLVLAEYAKTPLYKLLTGRLNE